MADQQVDARGLNCPMPIVKTAQAVKTLASGQTVEVLATDAGAVKDFAAWSKTTGNAHHRAVLGRGRVPLRPPEEVGSEP